METVMSRAKMFTCLIAANRLAELLQETPNDNKAAQTTLLYTIMILLDEARQLAGQDHEEVGQI